MNRFTTILVLVALPMIVGCAKKTAETAATATSTATDTAATDTTAKAPAITGLLARSQYDDGARAAESPVDAAMAASGERLFATKGCMTCHVYGKKAAGPNLKGVTTRRTTTWLVNQIMSPEVMTRTDPISHGLMVENKNLQMLNLHLTQDEALSLIEYFKKLDAAK